MQPLAGVRVLDLTRAMAGPYCTMMLGDLGAEVIKVENPAGGDESRTWGPPFVAGESSYFLSVNRNKRSVALNLRTPFGREALRRLAAASDVLVENFKKGSLDKLGVGYDALSQFNPRLIWASITGYGPTGPDADLPGYDLMAIAEGGAMSVTGEPDGQPMKTAMPIVDITTGMFTAYAIAAALRARELTGRGQRVDLSLLETTMAWLANIGSIYLIGGQEPRRLGNTHSGIAPYTVYSARDRYFALAVGNQLQWEAFCTAIGRLDLAEDPRFRTNGDRVTHKEALNAELGAVFATRDAADWVELLRPAGIPCALIKKVSEAFESPQAQARQMVHDVEHPTAGLIKLAGFPYKFSDTPASIRRPPPTLGQHTKEVLVDLLGFTEAEVEAGLAS